MVTAFVTRNPKHVSCGGCKRTKAYADRVEKMRKSAGARRSIPVTDPDLDAPDGAIVEGYVRSGDVWLPVEEKSL
jgi:hypothetical protein